MLSSKERMFKLSHQSGRSRTGPVVRSRLAVQESDSTKLLLHIPRRGAMRSSLELKWLRQPCSQASSDSHRPWCAHSCGGVTLEHIPHVLNVRLLYFSEHPEVPLHADKQLARSGATDAIVHPWWHVGFPHPDSSLAQQYPSDQHLPVQFFGNVGVGSGGNGGGIGGGGPGIRGSPSFSRAQLIRRSSDGI